MQILPDGCSAPLSGSCQGVAGTAGESASITGFDSNGIILKLIFRPAIYLPVITH